MVTYVYAVAESGAETDLGRGLADAPVDLVAGGDIVAACTRHERIDPRPTPESLWRHEEVVERLAESGPVLPVRFGSTFPSSEAVARLLRDHRDELRPALEQVRGRVELGVRVLWQPPDEPDARTQPAGTATASSGRAYLERRLDEQRRADARRAVATQRAVAIHAPLAARAAADTFAVLVQPGLLLSAAYLVDAGAVDDFRQAVERVAAASPDVEILCTGPWPPHSFTPTFDDGDAPHA